MIDIDAHHGNGTQAIFYDDPEVLTGSVHVDPGAGWFPHFLGFAAETGARRRRGRQPQPAAGARLRRRALARGGRRAGRLGRGGGARRLVVALGVDAAAGDPESPLEVTRRRLRAAGAMLGALGLPTVVVQEGGYDLEAIGGLVVAALTGLRAALSRRRRARLGAVARSSARP